MPLKTEFDIIIAGAGASGLSLLWFFLNSSLKDKKILVADRSLEPVNDKTWCFWDNSNIPYKNLVYHTWETLDVKVRETIYSETLKEFQYQCIRSADFTKLILNKAREHKNVTLLETEILSFSNDELTGKMETTSGNYSAPWIFQSALQPPGLENAKNDISLKQHFLGWEIETSEPLFDPKRATFMDFDVPQKNGITFLYELPFSTNRALIEFTLFSDQLYPEDEYKTGLIDYIERKYGLGTSDYIINRIEKGIIPMEDTAYPQWYCNRVMNIGVAGGVTKPTTGYTFTRAHNHARQIVQALEKSKIPPAANPSSYRFRVYDMMLLYLLKNKPKTSIIIFKELFRRNKLDRILQFLEEQTHFGQELAIFASLPSLPFFKAIYRMKHRIYTGA